MVGQFFIHELRAYFNLRKPKSDKPTTINFVCWVNHKQIKFSTGVKVYPDQWNIKKQEAYLSCRLTELDYMNNIIANNRLSEFKERFNKFKGYLCDNPGELDNSLDVLRTHIYQNQNMRKRKEINALHWLRDTLANDKTIKSTGNRRGASTLEIYIGQLKTFDKFLKSTGKDAITFKEIDLSLIKEYETYLFNKEVRKGKTTSTTTVGNKCSQIIAIIKRAEAYNLIDMHETKLDKYKKPKSRQGNDNEIYLTEEDINKIYSLELTGKEEQVRDLFVLQCWTGQRFTEISSLNNGIIKKTNEGKILDIVQKKTTHKVSLPLLPITLEILNKYKFKLPSIPATTTLEYLKKIGLKAGLTESHIVTEDRGGTITNTVRKRYELIGTHTARRSFICNMLKRGYDSHILMKISGHSTESAFKEYVKLTPQDAAETMLRIENKRLNQDLSTEPPLQMNCNDIMRAIREGISEGLKQYARRLDNVEEVLKHLQINKRIIKQHDIKAIVAMVVSLEKENTPPSVIVNMLYASGLIESKSGIMTMGTQYFLKRSDDPDIIPMVKALENIEQIENGELD